MASSVLTSFKSGVGGGGEVHCEWQGGGCRQGGRASNTPCKVSKMTMMMMMMMMMVVRNAHCEVSSDNIPVHHTPEHPESNLRH